MHKVTIVFALSIAVLAGLFLGTNNEAIAAETQSYTTSDAAITLIKQ